MSDVLKGNEYLEGEEAPEIVDLDGDPFEIIGDLEYEGGIYLALIPYEEDADETEEVEFVILKEEDENGECVLATVDDDDLYNKIGNMFLKMFMGED